VPGRFFDSCERRKSRARRAEEERAEAPFSSASDDEVGGSLRAMREQLQNKLVSFPQHEVAEALAKVRAACLAMPETSERLSHGGPAFFIRSKKCFVMFLDNHHGDGRLAIWCAAPDGVQADLVETDPERFFRPPYVGHLGWLGVQLSRIEDAELNAICREAFATVAPPSVLRMWRPEPQE
jgi:hypothetical protein